MFHAGQDTQVSCGSNVRGWLLGVRPGGLDLARLDRVADRDLMCSLAAVFHTIMVSMRQVGFACSSHPWVHRSSEYRGHGPLVVLLMCWTWLGQSLVNHLKAGVPGVFIPLGMDKIVAVGLCVCVADHKAQWMALSIAGASAGRRAWENPVWCL